MIGRVRNAGQDRLYPPAHILGEGAAWVEAAARRWIDRCRRIAREGRRLLATVDVHLRYRRQQCSGVGVLRGTVKDVYGPEFAIGRAHVLRPVTKANTVFRFL